MDGVDLEKLVDDLILEKTESALDRLEKAEEKRKKSEAKYHATKHLVDSVRDATKGDKRLAHVYNSSAACELLDAAKRLMNKENSPGQPDSTSLLGLKAEDVSPSEDEKAYFQSVVIPKVSLKLEADRKELLKFYDPSSKKNLCSASSSSPLSDAILMDMNKLKDEEENLVSLESQIEDLVREFCRAYDDIHASVLLLLRECLPIENQHKVTKAKWQAARTKCMNSKAKVVELNLKLNTYSPKEVKALKFVRYELNKKLTDVGKRHSRLTEVIKQYEAVDDEFTLIVDEYKEILKQIHNSEFILQKITEGKTEVDAQN